MKKLVAVLLVSLLTACGQSEEKSEVTLSELEEKNSEVTQTTTKEVPQQEESAEEIKVSTTEVESESKSVPSTNSKTEQVTSTQKVPKTTTPSKSVAETQESNPKPSSSKKTVVNETSTKKADTKAPPVTTAQQKTVPTQANTTEKTNEVAVEAPVTAKLLKKPEPKGGPVVPIDWTQFFDNGDQTKPSVHFTELRGHTVEIEAFMGEMISLSGGWFLIIPQPGAECPFCSTDGSYWNKIMIVFAENKNYVRYIPGKIKVTGMLDVGARKDESGYETMFRMYDAKFEAIQE